jgi:hypothetical protein
MLHVASEAGIPFLYNFASSKLVREPELVGQIPIITVAGKTVQHARYERIARANRTRQS